MKPQPARFVTGRKFEARTEIKQNIGDLRDHQFSCLEEWRRERRVFFVPAVHHLHHPVHAARLACDIFVRRTGILQRKPHKLAATLNFRPVEELISHGTTSQNSRARAWLAPLNDRKWVRSRRYQLTAKQYISPSPPVERRSACEQPPSCPREGCDEFHDLDASSSRKPCRSAWPSMTAPCVLLV